MPILGGFAELESRLVRLTGPVRLVFFTQTRDSATCAATRHILDGLAACSERITVEEYDLLLDKRAVDEYKIDRVPAVAIVGTEDIGIRFYGVPEGFELESIVEGVELASGQAHSLTEATLVTVHALKRDINLQVFVTPT